MRKDTIVIELPGSDTEEFWELMKREMPVFGTSGDVYEMTLLNKGVMDDHFPGYARNPEWWKKQYGFGGHA